jgi:hypothetical protein
MCLETYLDISSYLISRTIPYYVIYRNRTIVDKYSGNGISKSYMNWNLYARPYARYMHIICMQGICRVYAGYIY